MSKKNSILYNTMGQKRCSICLMFKEPVEFNKFSQARDNLSHYCREYSKRKQETRRREKGKTPRNSPKLVGGRVIKLCIECGITQTIENFHKQGSGVCSRCRSCYNQRQQERRSRVEKPKLLKYLDTPTHQQCGHCGKVKERNSDNFQPTPKNKFRRVS